VTVAGNTPNDLMDKRDLLLDQLSYKFSIQVDKREFNGIDLKPTEVGSMKAPLLVNSSPNGDAARFSYVTNVELDTSDFSGKTYIVTYYKNGNVDSDANKQTLKVTGITPEQAKEIKDNRIIWADKNGQAAKGDGYPIRDGEVISYSQLMVFKPQSGNVNGLVSVQKD
ncbi:FlgK family flagellar hook-associated protein, partial [Clostridium perfringens]